MLEAAEQVGSWRVEFVLVGSVSYIGLSVDL